MILHLGVAQIVQGRSWSWGERTFSLDSSRSRRAAAPHRHPGRSAAGRLDTAGDGERPADSTAWATLARWTIKRKYGMSEDNYRTFILAASSKTVRWTIC